MQHEWLVRVIADLQAYALAQGLLALAEHLDQARLLALAEIANLADPGDEAS